MRGGGETPCQIFKELDIFNDLKISKITMDEKGQHP